MIGGNDDDGCIFGEGERNVDLSLRKREIRDLRHPVRYLYRSIISISSSSRHVPREKDSKKKKRSRSI